LEAMTRAPRALYEAHCRLLDREPEPWHGEEGDLITELAGQQMTRPNLFDFATSELSQDAFLCWLLSWAHCQQNANDAALHQTAVALLRKLLGLHGIEAPGECELQIKRQHKDLDILVLVNGDIALLIEDKISASEH